jgi:replicative DNA helicase
MRAKYLLKAILDNNFYQQNVQKISRDLFPDEYLKYYDIVDDYYKHNDKSLSVDELETLFNSRTPALTSAARQKAKLELDALRAIELQPGIYNTLIQDAYVEKKVAEIVTTAFEIGDHKHRDFDAILNIIDSIRAKEQQEVVYADKSFEAIFGNLDESRKWKINFPPLQERLKGIGPGVFGIVAARPEAGKTAFMAHLNFAPDGFVTQGAKILWVANEEKYNLVMARCLSSYTGLTIDELMADKEATRLSWDTISDKIDIVYDTQFSIEDLETLLTKNKHDIIIIDQLDKLPVKGEFAREDQRYKELYIKARNIAINHNVAVIGVCQASSEADGKLYYGYEALDGSKTGKAAQADVIMCIGKNADGAQGDENYYRVINLPKNKLTGDHKCVSYMLQPRISRIME